ncbi:hypothetical protein BDK51DRAFT_49947 [Blyttiomyces helicus]|uniref:Uncharacterized protein n=1 Tax=Blyttiomyces helicus TaxID=388810 RepID=A0A4P9VWD7_9FUNG|nr:hypothetical protein BDK51DRAFT_49947 [Blyttiomyces helicus]|eukprot:RKO83472.1 hypothetical protein BDK51DRAFT_49947 [Blyttiomyces helicus]
MPKNPRFDIDMSLLSSEEQKNTNFINMLKVLKNLKNHEGLGKDIQEIYNNLPTSTNSIPITIIVKKWNGILERSNRGIVHHEPNSSCEIDGHHRICRGKKSDGRVFTYWINTTLFPIYKRRDEGDSDAESPGRHHPYARNQTSARRPVGSTYAEAVAASEAEAKRGFFDNEVETDAALTDVDRDGECEAGSNDDSSSEGQASPGSETNDVPEVVSGNETDDLSKTSTIGSTRETDDLSKTATIGSTRETDALLKTATIGSTLETDDLSKNSTIGSTRKTDDLSKTSTIGSTRATSTIIATSTPAPKKYADASTSTMPLHEYADASTSTTPLHE